MSQPKAAEIKPPNVAQAHRDDLAKARGAFMDLSVRITAVQGKVAKAVEARAAVPIAEAALKDFLFETALAGDEPDPEMLAGLRQSVRDARTHSVDVAAWEAELAELNAQARAIQPKMADLVAQIIEAEGAVLAETYHRHAMAAAKAEAALKALGGWALAAERTALGIALKDATKHAPDAAAAVVIYERRKAEVDAYGTTWRQLPIRLLNGETDAEGPNHD